MANSFPGTVHSLPAYASAAGAGKVRYSGIYRENCHRIYSLAFWMTGNEMAAEQLSANTFLRAFALAQLPTIEHLDRAFLAEVRGWFRVGELTLKAAPIRTAVRIQGRIKRTCLEQAMMQLPPTERLIFLLHDVEGYDHGRIARLLGILEAESQLGLHQARLELREQLASM